MAVQRITPTRRVEEKKGKKGGGGLGKIIGAAGGGVVGGLAGFAGGGPVGAAAGATGGAAAGASVGGFIGDSISPAKAGVREEFFNPSVQLSAAEEAVRGQQLLDGLRVAQSDSRAAGFAEPIAQAYVQSIINLKGR